MTPTGSAPDRTPMRVMFVTTAMNLGGQEMVLLELIRRLDRAHFTPEVCCLKALGFLGERLKSEIPIFGPLLMGKADLRVWHRLARLMRERTVDAVVTIGTGGDRMFWGRLAAWRARVPVVIAALHSSGTTRIEWLNRLLEPLTDAFVAVAETHRDYVISVEKCPAHKVRVIPNGVDVQRFRPLTPSPELRAELGIPPDTPVAGIVARMRPEKNLARFLRVAASVRQMLPSSHFLIVGDGDERSRVEALVGSMGLQGVVHFGRQRVDVPEVLSIMNVFVLTSDVETSPVSILEAMAAGKPAVSTRVGSVAEAVVEGVTGHLVQPGRVDEQARRVVELLCDPERAAAMGRAGRDRVIAQYSVERMVAGYEQLLQDIYADKRWESPRIRPEILTLAG